MCHTKLVGSEWKMETRYVLLNASLPFLKIFTQSLAITPAQTKLYPKSQGKDPSPNTHCCSYLGIGNMNHVSHPLWVRKGNSTGLYGQRYPGSLRDSLIPTPAFMPQAQRHRTSFFMFERWKPPGPSLPDLVSNLPSCCSHRPCCSSNRGAALGGLPRLFCLLCYA